MTPEEFNEHARNNIVAISRPARVVRSFTGGGLWIRIESLGLADFGDRLVAHVIERVEGSVLAGPLYRPGPQPETVALLVRRARDQAYWEVAGVSRLRANDRTRWTITLAKLDAGGAAATAAGGEEYRAMAVVLEKSIAAQARVTEAMLQDALAVSEEVRYHLAERGR